MIPCIFIFGKTGGLTLTGGSGTAFFTGAGLWTTTDATTAGLSDVQRSGRMKFVMTPDTTDKGLRRRNAEDSQNRRRYPENCPNHNQSPKRLTKISTKDGREDIGPRSS